MPKHKKAKMLAALNQTTKTTSPPKRVKESTIMKWLQNSDLNKNEGSLDIFKAICNENEDEAAADSSEEDVEQVYKFERVATDQQKQSTELSAKCIDFSSKLRNVEQNLKQLEAEIEKRTNSESNYANDEEGGAVKEKGKNQMKKKPKDVYDFDENSDDEEQDEEQDKSGASPEEDAFIISRNGGDTSEASTSASNIRVLSKHNKKYLLLKSSVNMLREAYNEIKDTVREETMRQKSEGGGVASGSSSPPPLVKLQSLSNNTTKANTTSPSRFLDTPESSRASCDDIDLDSDSISEVESISLNSPISSSQSTFKPETVSVATTNHLLEEQLKEYQLQVGKLNEKLHQTELEAHQTLEIMQVECDDVKHKMLSLNKVIEALREDKKALEQVINENKHNNHKKEKETRMPPPSTPDDVYHEIIETETQRNSNANANEDDDDLVVVENDLADINVSALEREEELITYKERLEEQQKENIDLRNEIATLKLKAGHRSAAVAVVAAAGTTTENLLKRFLPFGFVVLAIIVYFISTYF